MNFALLAGGGMRTGQVIGSTDKEEVILKGGHVSVVAGANAIKRLWPKLDSWLGERST